MWLRWWSPDSRSGSPDSQSAWDTWHAVKPSWRMGFRSVISYSSLRRWAKINSLTICCIFCLEFMTENNSESSNQSNPKSTILSWSWGNGLYSLEYGVPRSKCWRACGCGAAALALVALVLPTAHIKSTVCQGPRLSMPFLLSTIVDPNESKADPLLRQVHSFCHNLSCSPTLSPRKKKTFN